MEDNFWDILDKGETAVHGLVERATKALQYNILATEDAHIIQVLAPGLAKEDSKVELDDNLLRVTLEPKEECRAAKCVYRSFWTPRSVQEFSLPQDADKDDISAKMENGILTITIPKLSSSENAKKRTIAIGGTNSNQPALSC